VTSTRCASAADRTRAPPASCAAWSRASAGYGNAIGVPTVGGEVQFDAATTATSSSTRWPSASCRSDRHLLRPRERRRQPDPLRGREDRARRHPRRDDGERRVLAEGPSQRPTVQVGDPFMEKLLLEACLEIFAEDLLVGVQDMGAAGLTSSTVEMAGRAGNGVDLGSTLIPRRAKRLTPYEMLLSESQERMLMVAKPGRGPARARDLQEVGARRRDRGPRHRHRPLGRARHPGYDPLAGTRWPARARGGVRSARPAAHDDAPVYDRPRKDDPSRARRARPSIRPRSPIPVASRPSSSRCSARPTSDRRAWIYRQYDHIVRGGTVLRPGGDAAVVRAPACDGRIDGVGLARLARKHPRREAPRARERLQGRYCELDPSRARRWPWPRCAATSRARAASLSASPTASTSATPSAPRSWTSFATAIDGIAEACRALGVPIVSGNVSSTTRPTAARSSPRRSCRSRARRGRRGSRRRCACPAPDRARPSTGGARSRRRARRSHLT
jgi:hypothetical protein